MGQAYRVMPAVFLSCIVVLCGCQGLGIHDTQSLLSPHIKRSEVMGLVAGFGTTFASLPDLIAMLRRRSSVGMNPTMAAIMGIFQIIWIYYGLLIDSRPVILWNTISVLVNFLNVGAYFYFSHKRGEIQMKKKSVRLMRSLVALNG